MRNRLEALIGMGGDNVQPSKMTNFGIQGKTYLHRSKNCECEIEMGEGEGMGDT